MEKKSDKIKLANQLNSKLAAHLSIFEKNKEWADIGNWLQKIENILREFPSPNIIEKVTFAKRLAQCLNPMLPYGIHLQTLRVYEIIFKNMRENLKDNNAVFVENFSEDIGIYSVGLFPFFQYASSQVKPKILDLIVEYYFPLGVQLIPCMPGLVVSILPGLDEQNEDLQKKVLSTLDKAATEAGRKYLIGAIWMAILRTPKTRTAALKYLTKRIPKNKVDDEGEEATALNDEAIDNSDVNGDSGIDNTEDAPGAVTGLALNINNSSEIEGKQPEGDKQPLEPHRDPENSLQEEIPVKEGEEVYTNEEMTKQKELMLKDILEKSGLQNNDDNTNFPNRSSLVINAMVACLEDENLLVQRMALDFLNSHLKLNSDLFGFEQKLILVEAVLNLLIKKDMSVCRRVYTWLFGKPNLENKYIITEKNKFVLNILTRAFESIFSKNPSSKDAAMLPLFLIRNFYHDHDHLVNRTLKYLSLPILRYIYKYHRGYEFSEDVFNCGRNFMDLISSHFGVLLTSLSDYLTYEIKSKMDDNCLEITNLVEFTFDELVLKKAEGFDYNLRTRFMKSIIIGILRSFSSLNPDDFTIFKFILPAVNLLLKIMDNLEKLLFKNIEGDGNNEEDEIDERINTFTTYGDLEEEESIDNRDLDKEFELNIDSFGEVYTVIVKELEANQNSRKLLHLYNLASKILFKIQKFYKNKKLTVLPPWFNEVARCTINENQHISIVGVETSIAIFTSDDVAPIYADLKKLIMNMPKTNPVFQTVPFLRKGDDYTKVTFEKLWCLLDYHYYQNKIVELIISFQRIFPKVFSDVVASSFQLHSITDKEYVIRRFATFWRLTGEFSMKNDFDSTGLFIMLDFLENDNPLIRHSSKNWLMDSMNLLNRVLDPLLEVLLQNNSLWFVSETNQYFYTKVYDTKQTNEAFRKLNSILNNAKKSFIKYISLNYLTERCSGYIKSFINQSINLGDRKNIPYIKIIALIGLRYIQGHAVESLSLKFQMENASVNASSCEFLDSLIQNIERKDISSQITHMVMEPLLQVLGHSINNLDYVMQVQLLNLLRNILFQSSFCEPDDEHCRKNLNNLLSSRLFIPTLLNGLNSIIPYVRSQFIRFISDCIALLSNKLNQEKLKEFIKMIYMKYFEIIENLQKEDDIHQEQREEDTEETEYDFFYGNEEEQAGGVVASENPADKKFERTPTTVWANKRTSTINDYNLESRMNSVVSVNAVLAKGKPENTTKDEKAQQINLKEKEVKTNPFSKRQQNQNEIYELLEGVKTILYYFLYLKSEEPNSSHNQEEKKIPPSGSAAGSGLNDFWSNVFTLNIFNSNSVEGEKTGGTNHLDTRSVILEDLKKTLQIYVFCWRSSPEFKQMIEFSNSGFVSYSFKKFNEYKIAIKEIIQRSLSKKKTIKAQILSVLKPLTTKYTSEVTDAFVTMWMKECNLNYNDKPKHNTTMNNQIEMLIMLNLSPEMFINSLSKCSALTFITNSYLNAAKKASANKKGIPVLDYNLALQESGIFFLLYTYIAYIPTEGSEQKKEIVIPIWTAILKFFKLFSASRNPNTILWMLEATSLLASKYNPCDFMVDNKFKKELHGEVTNLLNLTAKICANQVNFQFNEPGIYKQATQILEKNPLMQSNLYRIIMPLTPTIYELYLIYMPAEGETQKIQQMMFNEDTIDEEKLLSKYRLFCFHSLKKLSIDILQSIYHTDKNERIVGKTKEFMDIIFPVMENKNYENSQIFVESSSELLYSLLETHRKILIKDFKKQILDIFMANDFFKCSKQTLKYWSKIIDWVVTVDKTDLFSEFLNKLSSFNFFFSKDSETRQKIKSFERICFIIYSGERDYYEKKLGILLEKISDVIKNAETSNTALLILILFCIRIIILRLSSKALNNLFRNIWPMLLSLLIQIFNKKGKGPQRNRNLILAALKLIEFISIIKLEEFYVHQWMFVFDYFGMKIEPNHTGITQSQAIAQSTITPFKFQPYMISTLPNSHKIDYINKELDEVTQKEFSNRKWKIVISQASTESDEDIKSKALWLCQYLITNNEFRAEVDLNQIETLIEGDFISLDDYIFKIN